MATTLDLGDKSANGSPRLQLGVDPASSDSVVVKVVAGDTVTYSNSAGESGTIASGASHTFTTPSTLFSAGRSSLKISDATNAVSKKHGGG